MPTRKKVETTGAIIVEDVIIRDRDTPMLFTNSSSQIKMP
jgi:hypothetical protein